MTIVLARVDNRLVHGQVLEAWVPRLEVQGIVVVDRELAADPLQALVFKVLDRDSLPVRVVGPEEAARLLDGPWRARRVLILFSGLAQAVDSRRSGVRFDALNLGNIHPSPGSRTLTPSVYLSNDDVRLLEDLVQEGVALEARAVPTDRSPDVALFLRGGP
ncbi:MAG: PTS sugar transporter subunit IIB [Deltaproteobacteria bacterium]|nr:PTS sugar transporter subunit IIB [Deltaproteobacteria bacterium]